MGKSATGMGLTDCLEIQMLELPCKIRPPAWAAGHRSEWNSPRLNKNRQHRFSVILTCQSGFPCRRRCDDRDNQEENASPTCWFLMASCIALWLRPPRPQVFGFCSEML